MTNAQVNIRLIENRRCWTFDVGAKCLKSGKRKSRYWNFDNRTLSCENQH